MKFKPGDRVRSEHFNDTGTVDHTYDGLNGITVVVKLDHVERLFRKEDIPSDVDRSEIKCHCAEDDLTLIGLQNKPEPDWKDIWDSNT